MIACYAIILNEVKDPRTRGWEGSHHEGTSIG